MIILLCDDEKMVRLGLKSMIEELYPDKHQFLEAANGKELLTKITLQPDLAFIDIRMPLLDGLTAIEKARDRSPHTKWIMLTGYSDFEYARKALQLGVSDYLLKPIGLEKLSSVMTVITQLIQKERQITNQQFKYEILNQFLYQAAIKPQITDTLFMPTNYRYGLFLFCLDSFPHDKNQLSSQKIKLHLEEYCSSHIKYSTVFYTQNSELCLVILAPESITTRLICYIENLLQEEWLKSTVTVCYQPFVNQQAQLYPTYRQMAEWMPLRIAKGFGHTVSYMDWEAIPNQSCLLPMLILLENLADEFRQKKNIAYISTLHQLKSIGAENLSSISQTTLKSFLKATLGLEVTLISANDLLVKLTEHEAKIHDEISKKTTSEAIHQIKNHIENHYMDDIGVDCVAAMLGITPNYLSRIFREQTGERFVDYLSQVRIGAAKQLLASDSSITMKEVSQKVGYFSARHFTKVFYRLTNMHPSTYQKNSSHYPF